MNAVETIGTVEATVAAVAPTVTKAPSKKSVAVAIFAAKLVERSQGLYASNKEFRAAVLRAIESELGVSTASAATMFNACKVDAEAADANVGLGRDPKVVKVKTAGSGKRGRPAGSKNQPKETTVVVTDATAEVVVTETVTAEAATA